MISTSSGIDNTIYEDRDYLDCNKLHIEKKTQQQTYGALNPQYGLPKPPYGAPSPQPYGAQYAAYGAYQPPYQPPYKLP